MHTNGNNPSLTDFPGSELGIDVKLAAGSYAIIESKPESSRYSVVYSPDCVGTIGNDETRKCIVTNIQKLLPSLSWTSIFSTCSFFSNLGYSPLIQALTNSLKVLKPLTCSLLFNAERSFFLILAHRVCHTCDDVEYCPMVLKLTDTSLHYYTTIIIIHHYRRKDLSKVEYYSLFLLPAFEFRSSGWRLLSLFLACIQNYERMYTKIHDLYTNLRTESHLVYKLVYNTQ
jgi:hypothetical protein